LTGFNLLYYAANYSASVMGWLFAGASVFLTSGAFYCTGAYGFATGFSLLYYAANYSAKVIG
jgi:hypothetical protein